MKKVIDTIRGQKNMFVFVVNPAPSQFKNKFA